MDFLLSVSSYVLPFLGVLTVLVFVHELGHYAIARYNNVRVMVFSIGFGPELFGWTDKSETRWKISAIPLGGYIKMFGEGENEQPGGDNQSISESEQKVSFAHKRLSQRVAIVFAGPFANFIFAIAILSGLFSIVGQPFTPPTVTSVQPGSAAEEAGIMAGDTIAQIDGRSIERFEEVQQIVRLSPAQLMTIIVRRGDSHVSLQVTPKLVEETDRLGNVHRLGRLGVMGQGADYLRHDPFTAVYQAGKETLFLTGGSLKVVGQMISGSRNTDELGGPIRIAQMSGEFARVGLVPLIWFTALLSINLGLINLFPIPMLDGGHLLFYAIEGIRGKPLGEKTQEMGFRIGLAFVFGLMIFVTINDLVQLHFFEFVKELIS
jgi:regulator of sigma E protease